MKIYRKRNFCRILRGPVSHAAEYRIEIGDWAARDDVSSDGRHIPYLLSSKPAEHLHDLHEHPRFVRLHPLYPVPTRLLQAAQSNGGSKFDCIAAIADAVEFRDPEDSDLRRYFISTHDHDLTTW